MDMDASGRVEIHECQVHSSCTVRFVSDIYFLSHSGQRNGHDESSARAWNGSIGRTEEDRPWNPAVGFKRLRWVAGRFSRYEILSPFFWG